MTYFGFSPYFVALRSCIEKADNINLGTLTCTNMHVPFISQEKSTTFTDTSQLDKLTRHTISPFLAFTVPIVLPFSLKNSV